MAYLDAQAWQIFTGALLAIFAIDAIIIALGTIYRRKLECIPPKFFGLMSGTLTESVIRKFGYGLIANTLFMAPVFLISALWIYGMIGAVPDLALLLVGLAVGFHLTLLLLSMIKLSLVMSFEARFGSSFEGRVKKAVGQFVK